MITSTILLGRPSAVTPANSPWSYTGLSATTRLSAFGVSLPLPTSGLDIRVAVAGIHLQHRGVYA